MFALICYFSLITFLPPVRQDTGLDRIFGLPCTDTLYILIFYSLLTSKKQP